MARKDNKLGTETIRISTNPVIRWYLEQLVLTGFFGKTAPEVAERFIAQECKKLVDAGQLQRHPTDGTQ